jgi:hypothetical protein
MPEEKRDWRKNAAATLDLLRNYQQTLFEVTAECRALRMTLEESDSTFHTRFSTHLMDLQSGELGNSNTLMLQLLEKNAGQLRDDPFWKD